MPRNVSKRSNLYRNHPVIQDAMTIEVWVGTTTKAEAEASIGADAFLTELQGAIQSIYVNAIVTVTYRATLYGIKVFVTPETIDRNAVVSNIDYISTIILNSYRDEQGFILEDAAVLLQQSIQTVFRRRGLISELKGAQLENANYGVSADVEIAKPVIVKLFFYKTDSPTNMRYGRIGCKIQGFLHTDSAPRYEVWTSFLNENDLSSIKPDVESVLNKLKTDTALTVASKYKYFNVLRS
jgi:hypothetical protein